MSGLIQACPKGCDFKCCWFKLGNYIVSLPGELEAALEAGASIDHLVVIGEYLGGKKVVCTARDASTCDGGYKPLDCRMYPLWPRVDDSGRVHFIIGEKCPLVEEELREHRAAVVKLVERLVKERPELAKFFNDVEMVGYVEES